MTNKAKFNISIVILSVLSVMGFGAIGYQLVNGLGVTGMNNIVSWGTYIMLFMFFVGLSAGGLIVSSSATVFNIPSFKVVAKPATILSTVCVIVAAAFIMVDLGSPFRVLNLLLHGQFKSPLMWDVVVINLYLFINVLYLYLMTRKETNEKALKIMSSIALPVAILVHSVTAWIFGLQIAREGWYTAIMAPLFVASALDSGLALLIIVLVLLMTFKIFIVEKKLITTLAGLLVTFVAVDAYLLLAEVLTMVYPQKESKMLIVNELVSGSLAPYFWIQVILGLVVPLAILLFRKNREKIGLVVFASALVVFGVLCKRIWLLFSAFIHPNIAAGQGITLGYTQASEESSFFQNIWSTVGVYSPTIVELMVSVGLISFGILLFFYLAKKILVQKSSQEDQFSQKEEKVYSMVENG
ncbi:NrfD/PsrC family molybdoenzyme membrane anchor subunit [Bacillus sp. B15-48]|uniref:NrfD/PsrC family molybdoenzyme membrane anchor subunit n=1 Tax=Bacillus sp. B15-48 TaxID=1548601 RepID=UPI00194014E6|nr:NrfD/PsrC family molybdoenzyme membrane anchor subunit [Bacillus sp. B15-48]MBM4765343.1 oxidoreductase [Bacillus sp. B15-48]